jgi:hypothetical protein
VSLAVLSILVRKLCPDATNESRLRRGEAEEGRPYLQAISVANQYALINSSRAKACQKLGHVLMHRSPDSIALSLHINVPSLAGGVDYR